jgi:hypothetical protein
MIIIAEYRMDELYQVERINCAIVTDSSDSELIRCPLRRRPHPRPLPRCIHEATITYNHGHCIFSSLLSSTTATCKTQRCRGESTERGRLGNQMFVWSRIHAKIHARGMMLPRIIGIDKEIISRKLLNQFIVPCARRKY